MTTVFKTPAGEQAVMALYDEALARWPVPYETLTIPTRHGETFVITSGDPAAPPLVLLHGAGSNSTVWAGDVAAYSAQYRVYAADLPGEAGKSAPNRPPWDSPAFGEWLADVFDALQVEWAALLGISQGGWTALKFATAQPERVTRLVLLCPGGVVPDRRSFLPRAVGLMLLGRWGLRRMTRLLFGEQPAPDGVEEILVTVSSHFKPRIGVLPVFSDDELRRLTMPVYLVGGDRDIIRDTTRIAARLRALLPDVAVTIVPGAGHAVIGVSERVLDFLAGA